MGKALDLHFNKNGQRTRNNKDIETIRKCIFNKYLGAKWDWKHGQINIFNMESTEIGATTWVHYDVREFETKYLLDKFFTKDFSRQEKSIVNIATEAGLKDLCKCMYVLRTKKMTSSSERKKYKWAHSAFGNLIAQHESSDNYNLCDKTKGGLKVIDDINIVNLTIEEIQDLQSKRDIFAVGRCQLIPNTLNKAILYLGIDVKQKLNEEIQDRIFDEYLIKIKRPQIIKYLESEGTIEDAMYASAKEWAAIGVAKGMRISNLDGKKKICYWRRIILFW